MQLSIVEYARNVAGLDGAHSIELDPNTQYPVIALMPDQNGVEDIGGTLRLGSFPCMLDKTSKAYELYGEELIHERHRHRYEVNNDYRAILTEHGMTLLRPVPGWTYRGDDRAEGSSVLHRNPGFTGTEIQTEPAHIRCSKDLWKRFESKK